MTATLLRPTLPRCRFVPPRPVRRVPPTPAPVWHWAGLVLIATGLLFCHGCHNHDVDDELCVPLLRERRETPIALSPVPDTRESPPRGLPR